MVRVNVFRQHRQTVQYNVRGARSRSYASKNARSTAKRLREIELTTPNLECTAPFVDEAVTVQALYAHVPRRRAPGQIGAR